VTSWFQNQHTNFNLNLYKPITAITHYTHDHSNNFPLNHPLSLLHISLSRSLSLSLYIYIYIHYVFLSVTSYIHSFIALLKNILLRSITQTNKETCLPLYSIALSFSWLPLLLLVFNLQDNFKLVVV